MPFPLLFIAVAAVAGTGGVVAAVDGLDSMSRAKDIGNEAKSRHEAAVAALEERRKVTQTWIEAHASNKQAIVKGSLSRALMCFEALRKRNKLNPINSVRKVDVSAVEIEKLCASISELQAAFGATLIGAGAGAAVAGAATTAAALFGTAGTGVAIGSLSGAAAQSATLAWLGGGSLATGGGGMALGSVVLTSLALGPALLVGGFILSIYGDEALAKARGYSKEVDEHVVSLEAMKVTLSAIEQRIEEIEAVMGGFSRCLDAVISRINPDTYNPETDKKNYIGKAIELTKALTTTLRAPILTHDFKISNESANLTLKYRNLLENGYV